MALARAPLLAELTDDWALEAQDRAREDVVRALEALADAAEAAGDLPGAVAYTRRAVRADRLRESAHRALMRRLAAMGEVAQAAEAYRRCRAILAHEFGVAPAPETRALAASLRGDAPPEAPATEAPPARRAPAEPDQPPRAALGRARELGVLEAAWTSAASGRGGVALVQGPAGIGKTCLAAWMLARVAHEGGLAVEGAALDVGAGPPLAAWSEAVRGLVRAVAAPPATYAWPGDLARLCPAVERVWDRAAAPAAAPDEERARLGESVVEAIGWAARERPVLVVLEDVHAADAASLGFLAYVGRRLRDLPALLLVTARGGAPGLDAAVDALQARDSLLAEVAVGPLADDAVAGLARRAAPGLADDDVARVVALAGGNPLVAREAARAVAVGNDASSGLEASLRRRLAGLDDSARLLVDLAAVAGRPLTPGEAAELVGAEALGPALDGGVAAGLLEVRADRRIAFAHDLLRDAAEAAMTPGRRVWAHGRLAEALGRRPGRQPAEIARHLRAAGHDGPALAQLAAAAASARGLGALDEAASFLEQAAEVAPDDGSAAEVLLDLAEVHAWRGDDRGFRAAFDRAVGHLTAADDDHGLAMAWLRRGRWLLTIVCDPYESGIAFARAGDALARLGEPDAEAETLLAVGRGWAAAASGVPEDAEVVQAALRAAPDPDAEPALAAELQYVRAMLPMAAGHFADVEAPMLEAERQARLAGVTSLAQLARICRALAAFYVGDFDGSLAIATAVPRDEPVAAGVEMQWHATRAYVLSRLGRHAEAQAAAATEAAAAARLDQPIREAHAAQDAGAVALAAGDGAAARTQLAHALDLGGGSIRRPLARLQLAEAYLLEGDLDGAAAELGRVPFEPVRPVDLPGTLVPRMSRLQGLIAEARGDRELALRRLGEAEAAWRHRLSDDPGDRDAFGAGIADLGRVPVGGLVEPALELGRVLAERARVLAAAGRPEEASAAAREALELADAVRFDGYRAAAAALAATPEVS